MKKIVVTAICALGIFSLSAQPGNQPAPTPFGFVEVLIFAGAAYGGKKMYDAKKNEEV